MEKTHICICKYPIFVIDNRDGQAIEYLAMPIEVIKEGDMPVPTIDYDEAKDFDGVVRQYIKVQWQEIKKGDILKKYDVAGHIVTAGCELGEAIRSEGDEGLTCDEKSIYTVLHPAGEWVDQHVILLENQTENKLKGG